MAISRFEGLKKRLKRDSDLHTKYTEQMEAIIPKGYAEAVPENEIESSKRKWCIPHHPVINPKKPDKVCIVYECAAVVGSKSFNDFLIKGPGLTNSLVGVLLQFCKGKVAVIANVEAMFYQIKVTPYDKDALRFFWWPQGEWPQGFATRSILYDCEHLWSKIQSKMC